MGPDDNVGIDSGEGVEISGPAGTGLDGYVIVLYNGANRMIYSYSALDGVIPDQLGGFGAVFFSFNFSVQMTSTSFDPFHHARFNQRPQPRAPGARSTAWQSARASGGAVVLRLFLWHHNGGCVAIGVTAPPPPPPPNRLAVLRPPMLQRCINMLRAGLFSFAVGVSGHRFRMARTQSRWCTAPTTTRSWSLSLVSNRRPPLELPRRAHVAPIDVLHLPVHSRARNAAHPYMTHPYLTTLLFSSCSPPPPPLALTA